MGGSAKSAGGGATQRFNYHASGAVLICGGKTTALKGIEVRDKWEWTGLLLEESSPNPVQITVLNYGNGLLYWGRDDQYTPAEILQAANNGLGHDHPAYTSCTYFVCVDGWLLGLETRNQPNMRFHTLRTPQQSLITGPAAELVDGQANPFTIKAELYTSRRLGRGMPLSLFAAATWQAAADAAYANNAATYVSVLLTESTNGKSIAQDLLAVCDGYLRQQDGTGLAEAGVFTPAELINADSLPVIDRHWLTNDGDWDDETWSDVYSRVVVSFRDRNKNFKTRSVRYDDPVAHGVGNRRSKTFKIDHIVREGQALAYAQKLGSMMAIPGASGKLTVRPEKAIALRPGQHVRVDIDAEPGGAERRKVCRIVKITRSVGRDTVLEVETERQLDAALYTPTTPTPVEPPEVVIPDVTHARLFEAPYLLADREAYHIGVLASRPDGMVTSYRVHYDNVSGGDFPSLGNSRAYALRGRLNTAYGDSATGAISVELLDSLNREIIADNPGDTAARDDTLLMIVLKIAGSGQISADVENKAFIEIFSVAEIVAATTDVVDVTALRARLGTPARSFPAAAEVWFIRRDALTILGHADFATLAAAEDPAYFKLQPSGTLGTRPIEDCTQREFSFAVVRDLPPDVVDDGITPNPVSGVTITPGFNSIWLQYTPPENTPLRAIRIYESTTSTMPGAPSLFVSGTQNFAVRQGLPAAALRYYWLQPEATNGRLGPIVGPYSATTVGDLDLGSIEATLAQLEIEIDTKIIRSPTAPASPTLHAIWFDTTLGRFKMWDGFNWQDAKDSRLTVVESAVSTAQGTANAAVTAANAAQTTADGAATAASTAQTAANAANTNAAGAQSTANAAVTAANAAQSTADGAASAASSAQTTANTAITNAAGAQSTANAAASSASAAQSTADGAASAASSAQTTANTAITNAAGAQSTANAAASSASAAQTTADGAAATASSAVSAASSAQGTANSAASTASAAVTAASTAQSGVNSLAAEHVLQVTTVGGGVTRIAGFRVTNQGGASGASDFIIQADKFGFVNTSGAGAVAPFAIIDGIVYLNTTVIKDATITSGKVISLVVDKLETGTINSKELVLAGGAAGILRTDTFSPGVSGWRMRADGSVEFNDALIRGTLTAGKVATNSSFFNPANPALTFSSVITDEGTFSGVHMLVDVLYEETDPETGEVIDSYYVSTHVGGTARYPLTDFYGWASGSGYDANRFGKSTMTFVISGGTSWDIVNYGAGLTHADIQCCYRINGGGWTDFGHVTRHVFSGGPRLYYGAMITLSGLLGTDHIEFGVKFVTPSAQNHNGTFMNVIGLNV